VNVLADTAPLARLRLRPAPEPDPPYDDDSVPRYRPVGGARADGAVQTELPLLFVLPTGTDSAPDALFDRQPTPTHCLPDPRVWAARLSRAAVEVQVGVRPVTQLRRWLSDDVYADLLRASRRRADRSARVAEPGRRQTARPPRVVLRTVRACEVTDGVVEACAVVDDGRRAWALVLRLEGADGRWRCTELQRVSPGANES
jgi:Family of unknown function (DUF6459)